MYWRIPALSGPRASRMVVSGERLKASRSRPGMRRRMVALLNTGAGTANHVRDRLKRAFAAHGVDAELRVLTGAELKSAASQALAAARRGEIAGVVVGGGDGSIRTVAGVLADSGVPLGVLPLGTMNHFAKDSGIPLELDKAIETIACGQVRAVDLAEVNGEVFINNSSIGMYPTLVIAREQLRQRHRLAKWIAMGGAFFRLLRHFPRRRLRVSIAGRDAPYRTPCLLVGNNKYALELFAPKRRKRLDSGELWLYVVKPRTPLGFFLMVCRLCFGRGEHAHDIDAFETGAAEIEARASRLPVALDGEVEIMHTPLRYRSRPGALKLIVPGLKPGSTSREATPRGRP
jgi:diacylglycerol kinase family enzyme